MKKGVELKIEISKKQMQVAMDELREYKEILKQTEL